MEVAADVCKRQRVPRAVIVHHAGQGREPQKDGKRDYGTLACQAACKRWRPVPKRTSRRPSEHQDQEPGGNVEPEGGRDTS
jgi:hypothetical protein